MGPIGPTSSVVKICSVVYVGYPFGLQQGQPPFYLHGSGLECAAVETALVEAVLIREGGLFTRRP